MLKLFHQTTVTNEDHFHTRRLEENFLLSILKLVIEKNELKSQILKFPWLRDFSFPYPPSLSTTQSTNHKINQVKKSKERTGPLES